MIKTLTMPTITQPVDIDKATATASAKAIWKKRIDMFVAREDALAENNKALYALVLGQCTEPMRNALAGHDSFEEADASLDGLSLLRLIKGLVYQFHSQKYLPHTIHEATRRLMAFQQPRTMTVATYLEQFQNLVDVIQHTGGTIGFHNGIIAEVAKAENVEFENATEAQVTSFQVTGRERYLATAFFLNSDRSRFGRLIEDTENGFLKTHSGYPETVNDAYNLLVNWKQDPRNYAQVVGGSDGVSFNTVGDDGITLNTQGRRSAPGKGKNAPDISTITCFKCGEKGHYSPDCPSSGDSQSVRSGITQATTGTTPESGTTLLMHGIAEGEFDHEQYQFLQHGEVVTGTVLEMHQHNASIPDSWVLLDSQSTIDVFRSKELLHNVRQSPTRMRIHSNAGTTVTDMVGDYPGYGTVWYDPKGIANILSMSQMVTKGYGVQYDSKVGNKFIVHDPEGNLYGTFVQAAQGLYYQDITGNDAVTLVSTVDEIKSKYTNRDYQRAVLARKLQRIIGRPSTRQFIDIVDRNLLPNCPVTRQDIVAAEHIFGPDVGSLKGKTVRRPGFPVETQYSDVPASIMSRYRSVTLGGDIMFVNKVPILVTISRNIKFGTAQMVANQKAPTLLAAAKQIKAIYSQRGFTVDTMLMDGQFEPLRAGLADLQITLNTVANDEHVPEAERYIRTVKERMRSVYNTLPFERLPVRMIMELAYYCVYWLNSFPATDGVSPTLSPRAIIAGTTVDFAAHCRLEFGTYVQTHEQHNNSMHTRTTGAIALRPTGNLQGGHYFYSLNTGLVLRRNRWTSLPIPAEVISRVHALARRNRATPAGLHMVDRNGAAIPDDDSSDSDDSDYVDPGLDDDDDGDYDDPGLDAADDAGDNGYDPPPVQPDAGVHPIAGVVHDNAYDDYGDPDADANDDVVDVDAGDAIHDRQPEVITIDDPEDDDEDIFPAPLDATVDDDDDQLVTQMDAKYGQRTGAHNLRARRKPSYAHLHTILAGLDEDLVQAAIFTQYGVKKGLEMFGDDGANAILKELRQLHDRQVISPVSADSLTTLQKKMAPRLPDVPEGETIRRNQGPRMR